jgi:hypothetical protein
MKITNIKIKILGIVALKKFTKEIKLNSGLLIKRISKLFALIEKHIRTYVNITNA